MKIHVRSNFVVPGLEGKDAVELDTSQLTLREFLETLSKMARDPVEYVSAGADRIDPVDWEVDINGVPYQDYPSGLDTALRDGDTITIRLMALGGG